MCIICAAELVSTAAQEQLYHPPFRRTPNEPASPETLRALGVLSWNIDPDTPKGAARLAAVKRVRGYSYEDLITISPTALPGYEQKIKNFFEEHIHSDEEVRYVVDGSGYFDIRDLEDRWIRIAVHKGDMIVLPEGIYHRFTLDSDDYIKVCCLSCGRGPISKGWLLCLIHKIIITHGLCEPH